MDLPGGTSFHGQVQRIETNTQNKIRISVDLLDICKDDENKKEYRNLVQLIQDGPKLKDLPEDHPVPEFVYY